MTTNATGEDQARRRRWTRIKVVGLVLIACSAVLLTGLVGGYVHLVRFGEATLRDAVAEADRLDPGWRLEEIEAKRQADVIPANEDAAALVLAALDLIPEDWRSTDPEVRATQGPFRGLDLDESLGKLAPNERLGPDQAAGLSEEMEELAEALEEARPLADMSRGRFVVGYKNMIFDTLLPDTQNSRKLVRVLSLAAVHHAERGDFDAALDDCRTIVGVSHSVGDEPVAISQLVRLAEEAVGTVAVERVLAQGEASEAALARVQHRLKREAMEPFLLTGVRGERAAYYDLLSKIADGRLSVEEMTKSREKTGAGPPKLSPHAHSLYQYNLGLGLRLLNRAVEISKLPLYEQHSRWKAWEQSLRRPSDPVGYYTTSLVFIMMPSLEAFHTACVRINGMLNITQLMVAMERFRLARGRWPESLDEIPKSILPETPIDPYSGRPVRAARVPDGWVVYCVGPDLTDDGGKLDPRFKPDRKGTDWGYRLWDVPHRRRPPAEDDPGHELPDHPQPATEPNR